MRRGRYIVAKEMTDEEKNRRRKKVEALRHMAKNIQRLRAQVNKDLKSDDEKTRLTALAVALMDKTAERVGNEESAKEGHLGFELMLKPETVLEDRGSFTKVNLLARAIINEVDDDPATVCFFGSLIHAFDEIRESFNKKPKILVLFF